MNEMKDYVLNLLTSLEIPFRSLEHDIYEIDIPERYRAYFNNRKSSKFTFDKEVRNQYDESDDLDYVAVGTSLMGSLDRMLFGEVHCLSSFIAKAASFSLVSARAYDGHSIFLEKTSQIYLPAYEVRVKLNCRSDDVLVKYVSVHFSYSTNMITGVESERMIDGALVNDTPDDSFFRAVGFLEDKALESLYDRAVQSLQKAEIEDIDIINFEKEANGRLNEELERLKKISGYSSIQEEGIKGNYRVNISMEFAGVHIRYFPFFFLTYNLSRNSDGKALKIEHRTPVWKPKSDEVKCPSCSQEDPRLAICDFGDHVVCGECLVICNSCGTIGCGQHSPFSCKEEKCESAICSVCGLKCKECGKDICSIHANKCSKTREIYCSEHIVFCSRCSKPLGERCGHGMWHCPSDLLRRVSGEERRAIRTKTGRIKSFDGGVIWTTCKG